MAIIEWSSLYPIQLDTTTQQPTLTNNTDKTRVSQIHAMRDGVQELESQVGTGSIVSLNIKQRLDTLEAVSGGLSLDDAYDAQPGVLRKINVDDEGLFLSVTNPGEWDNSLYIEALSASIAGVKNLQSIWLEVNGVDNSYAFYTGVQPYGTRDAVAGYVEMWGDCDSPDDAVPAGSRATSLLSRVRNHDLHPATATLYGARVWSVMTGAAQQVAILVDGDPGSELWDVAFSNSSGDINFDGGPVRMGVQASTPSTPAAGKAKLFTQLSGTIPALYYMDDSGSVAQVAPTASAASAGGASNLQQAYDGGASITASAGAVHLVSSGGSTDILTVDALGSYSGDALISGYVATPTTGNIGVIYAGQTHIGLPSASAVFAEQYADAPIGDGDGARTYYGSVYPHASDAGELIAYQAELKNIGSQPAANYVAFEATEASVTAWDIAFRNSSGDIHFDGGPVRMGFQAADPTTVGGKGYFYTKLSGSTTEAYYMDDSGSVTQLTNQGAASTVGVEREQELVTTGSEGSLALSEVPLVSSGMISGRVIVAHRNGILARFATGSVYAASDFDLWNYNSGSQQVEFSASSGDWWHIKYKSTS